MEIKLKGDVSKQNYISIMETLFQYIETDFEKYEKGKGKDTTIIYRLDYSNTPLFLRKNLIINCRKTKTQYIANVSER